MNKFSFGFKNNNIYNSYTKDQNIIILTQNRANIFSNEKIFSRSYLEMSNIKIDDIKQLKNFINKKDVSHIVSNNSVLQSSCLDLKKIATIKEIDAKRNFFGSSYLEGYLFKADTKNC